MSLARRILPDAPARRGWCPGLARPMPTGDGLLARIHPPLGRLTLAQVAAVAEAARVFGNGHVDVTARANLQIRGVRDETRAGLVAAMATADLGDARADGGPQRLTLTSPHAGFSPGWLDVPALARTIEHLGRGIAGLPPKTLVLIEGGGATAMPGIEADLHIRATQPGRVVLGLAGDHAIAWIAACEEAEIAGSVAVLLATFAETGARRIRDLAPDARAALADALPARRHGAVSGQASSASWVSNANRPASPGAFPAAVQDSSSKREDAAVLDLEAPFGRCTADMLDGLATAGRTLGADEIRLSTSRGFVLRVTRVDALAAALADLAVAGFVTASDDPRRAVAACPGAPACGSGSTPTGLDAARLAEAFRPFAARGMTAHVSGCGKGCAHPGRADLTLVGRDGLYGIVPDGAPGDAPILELAFEAALERLRRAPGTLADAFRTPA